MKITAEEVRFRYPNTERPALRGLDFEVDEGEIFGFLGPSGAGKSTTLGILTGTLSGWTGTVSVSGTDPSKADGNFYREIGVCFESPRFHMKFSAEENLRLFGALYGTPLRDIGDIMSRLDLGNDRDKKVEAYSKGMKTRLSVARSILHDPSLIFLDEPTNGLDPTLSGTVCDLILEERDRGKTVFLTTHDMVTAERLCDRVGFLCDGELAVVDSPADLALRYGRREVRVVSETADAAAIRAGGSGPRAEESGGPAGEAGPRAKENSGPAGEAGPRAEESDPRAGRRAGENHASPPPTETTDFPMDGLADNAGFLNLLRGGGVRTIHSREAGLGDIFRQVTGKALG